jgi:hypothetical protein
MVRSPFAAVPPCGTALRVAQVKTAERREKFRLSLARQTGKLPATKYALSPSLEVSGEGQTKTQTRGGGCIRK